GVVRLRVAGCTDGPARAVFRGGFARGLGRLVTEDGGGEGPARRAGVLSDLRVVGEESHRRIRDREAGAAGTVVEELEAAVLIVRASRNRLDVDLIEVILARVLDDHTGLDGMTPFDERRRVREAANRSLRRGRVGPAVDLGEAGD